MLARQPAGDLLGRPSHRKAVADESAQRRLARQLVTTATPPPPLGELDRPIGAVAAGRPMPRGQAVAPEFAADRAWSAHQGGGDLSERLAGCMQPANRFALCVAELRILGSHRNAMLTKALRLIRELRESSSGGLDSHFRGSVRISVCETFAG